MFKEIPKRQFDKSLINSWCTMLYDIWGSDISTIKKKLIILAQDKFIWTDEIMIIINQEVNKILN